MKKPKFVIKTDYSELRAYAQNLFNVPAETIWLNQDNTTQITFICGESECKCITTNINQNTLVCDIYTGLLTSKIDIIESVQFLVTCRHIIDVILTERKPNIFILSSDKKERRLSEMINSFSKEAISKNPEYKITKRQKKSIVYYFLHKEESKETISEQLNLLIANKI
jgi:hypothetical protein